MLNNVVIVGRLTRQVDLRYTGSGTAVGNFTIATDRPFANQQGERETDFISCVIWGKRAENFANFTRKGSLVGIRGRIQTRNYENQQGQRVYITEVVAEDFALLEPKSVTEQRPVETGHRDGMGGAPMNGANPNDFFGQSNFTNQATPASFNSSHAPAPDQANPFANDPFLASGDTIDVSDDDLPF